MITFHNPGRLDLNALRLMGVSAKTGENPIGFFGTGLKYAIATLLRTRHSITIEIGGIGYPIDVQPTEFRGKSLEIVTLAGEPLGITTDLGRNWTPMMAFRELHSNALDEGGGSTSGPVEADTCIRVSGDGIEDAYCNRDQMFLSRRDAPLYADSKIEIYSNPSTSVFYRGVNTMTLPRSGAFTYNILDEMLLTEDRTISSVVLAYGAILEGIVNSDNPALFHILGSRCLETQVIAFYYPTIGPNFLAWGTTQLNNAHFPERLKKMIEKLCPVEITALRLTSQYEATIAAAIAFCNSRLGTDMKQEDFIFVRSLGAGIMGECPPTGPMKIAEQAIMNGRNYLAATLYEEWVHRTYGHEDESRGLQQFLFDRLISLAEQL